MHLLLPSWLHSLLPALPYVDKKERFRSCMGALLGIFFTGLISITLPGNASGTMWLAAPMGASAVLLFAVPASPLAQPWSILGGNVISALIGVSCAKLIGIPMLAASAAIFLAIAAMFALRCIHPPGGAVALTAVLGGQQVHLAAYGFVLAPVGLNTVLLLACAILYNKATGRRYPHTQLAELKKQHADSHILPKPRPGFTPEDLAAALKDYNQVLDVSLDDLETLFRQTERKAFNRRFGTTQCGQIMSPGIVSVEYATELEQAWQLMQEHAIEALPVVNRARHVIGIVTRTDFLNHANLENYRNIGERFRHFLRKNTSDHSDKHEVVGQIMSDAVKTVFDNTPMSDLVPLMSDKGLHHIPVINARHKLVGMLTQTDLVSALYEASLSHLDRTS